MPQRFALPALAVALAFLPVRAATQELAAVAAPAFRLPAAPLALSPECQSKRIAPDKVRHPLKSLSRAVRAKPHVKVLAIGSSSTVGLGASSPTATYVARLEPTLEGALKGIDFDVVGRGMSGEEAQGAADRMRKEVEDAKPDLVVWQVGTNDALRHVELDKFKNLPEDDARVACGDRRRRRARQSAVRGIRWSRTPTTSRSWPPLPTSPAQAGVLLVDRFDAMRELQRERGDRFYLTADSLHMNDVGYRCMAEQLARAIVGGLVQADAEQTQPVFDY